MTNEADTVKVEDRALAEFTEYFVRNYPGPNTIIGDPKWHAPKIFRAARHALRRLPHEAEGKTVESLIEAGLARNIAVTSVDARHGYTMEFAPSPAEHRDEYYAMEKAVEYGLRSSYAALSASPSSLPDPGVAARDVLAERERLDRLRALTGGAP